MDRARERGGGEKEAAVKEAAKVFHAKTRQLNSLLYGEVRHLPPRLTMRRSAKGQRVEGGGISYQSPKISGDPGRTISA